MKLRQATKVVYKILQRTKYRRNTCWKAIRRLHIDRKCELILKSLSVK